MIKRIFLIVMDSLGIGALPDAAAFSDEGSNTLAAIRKSRYFKGENLKDEMRFLFTFNLMFGMNFAWNGYESLVQIISKEHLFVTDFAKPAQGWINWLVERGSLCLILMKKKIC